MAEENKNLGNEEYKKKNFSAAINYYSKAIGTSAASIPAKKKKKIDFFFFLFFFSLFRI